MMTNCSPKIIEFMESVESGQLKACKDLMALVRHVRYCFENEEIYVDEEQFQNYLGLAKYFDFERLFPWQEFVSGLHNCTYWKEDDRPRWPDLFCLVGRGAGKDGTIAWDAVAVTSHYNGIPKYDVDICANNEEQAKRPVKDIVEAFEAPENVKKLKKYFYWTKEQVTSLKTGAIIKGRTNSPKGKDGLRSGKVIFNEVHQYEDYRNINVFTTGLGKKRHPRRAYYTTQGDVRDGPLDDLLNTCERILFGGEPDNGLLPFICRLDDKEEVHDESNWVKANPSLSYLPSLMDETRKEYREWKENPYRLPAFMTKRMNIPDGTGEVKVTDYENIKATNKELPDMEGWRCVVGIDYAKVTDFVSVNLHFRKEKMRYCINHSWLCLKSRDISRIKAPWKEWADRGLLTLVDDVEINPSLIVNYIAKAQKKYSVEKIAMDNFRYALLSAELKKIGFDGKDYKNIKLVRPSDIMKIAPVIDSCFANQYFVWGDNPVLRWATNNTMLIRFGRTQGESKDVNLGNYTYGKIEGKSRKTDPFMALVASMTIEDELPEISLAKRTEMFKVYSY